MSDSIHCHDHLLARGRRFMRFGLHSNAQIALRQLLRQPDVVVEARGEAHRLLGEIELAAGHFGRARRHLATAIGLCPKDAAGYLLYAAAVEADPEGDPRKARAALRRAIRIDAGQPHYWSALGRLEQRVGERRRALRAFRQAARLRPEANAVLTEVVDGLVSLGRQKEARRVLVAARFRAPFCAAVAQAWSWFRFDWLQRRQARIGIGSGEARILPFPDRTESAPASGASAVVIRADRRSRPTPHVLRLFGISSDRQAR